MSHAVAEVYDARGERAGVDEVEGRALFSTREERVAAADKDRVDAQPVLVDEIDRGGLDGEGCATNAYVALSWPSAPRLDLLGQSPVSQLVAVQDRRQGGGEDDLRQ